MKVKQLRNQKVSTINHKTNHVSEYRRDVTVYHYDDAPEEAECLLHGGTASLKWTGDGWKVLSIHY